MPLALMTSKQLKRKSQDDKHNRDEKATRRCSDAPRILSLKKGRQPDAVFEAELERSMLAVFEPIADLGYFGWNPNTQLGYKDVTTITDPEEIKQQIRVENVQPPMLVDISKLPLPQPFAVIEGPPYMVKYPFKTPIVAPLYIAKRHYNLNVKGDIDFMFHGSALSWLAKRDHPSDESLRVLKIPHTNIISVSKDREYSANYFGPGFQFESFVTGKEQTYPHEIESIEHLHVVKFEEYTILFAAEVDAIRGKEDGINCTVEITVSNWVQNKIFQMISNGSAELCYGVRNHTTGVQDIRVMSLSSLIANHFSSLWIPNISSGLKALKNASFTDGTVYRMVYGSGRITFETIADSKVLPSRQVLEDLFSDDSSSCGSHKEADM